MQVDKKFKVTIEGPAEALPDLPKVLAKASPAQQPVERPTKSPESSPARPSAPIAEQTGYKPADIMKAPLRPPELQAAGKPDAGQQISVIAGLVLVLLGAAGWVVLDRRVVLALVVIGVVSVLLGAFVRTGRPR